MARWRGRQSQTGLQSRVHPDDENEDHCFELLAMMTTHIEGKSMFKGCCGSYAGSHNRGEGGRPTRSICEVERFDNVCIFLSKIPYFFWT